MVAIASKGYSGADLEIHRQVLAIRINLQRRMRWY